MVEVGGIEPPSETGLRTNLYTLSTLLGICKTGARHKADVCKERISLDTEPARFRIR